MSISTCNYCYTTPRMAPKPPTFSLSSRWIQKASELIVGLVQTTPTLIKLWDRQPANPEGSLANGLMDSWASSPDIFFGVSFNEKDTIVLEQGSDRHCPHSDCIVLVRAWTYPTRLTLKCQQRMHFASDAADLFLHACCWFETNHWCEIWSNIWGSFRSLNESAFISIS